MKPFVTLLATFLLIQSHAFAQMDPFRYWTLLSKPVMDEIIGEASGETAWNTIVETGGYNKDRLSNEYEDTFYESTYILEQLKAYGIENAQMDRYPGGEVWDGIKGELWEVSPERRKLASYRDMTAMLAKGSTHANVKAELVWIGQGSEEEVKAAKVKGKIVVTEGSIYTAHSNACQNAGALGVVAISQSRPHFDPIQIPWSGIGGWRSSNKDLKFGFFITAREGEFLKKRLVHGETITVHAQVEAKNESYDLQNVTCLIPGTDPAAEEVIFSAHLFEGYTKQGANDNKSGSAGILEVARVLHQLIEEGRIPQPRRNIRFLWGPEFSGTGPWVKNHKELMKKTLCNINMDMVGEWLSKNQAYMCLIRTTLGNAHYINDVMENYYRYVGEVTRERIYGLHGISRVGRRILAPTGSDEPFYYSIETHSGSSDHEVFNDWAVGVPGVMMIAWPDQWYHTSGDRPDKADPTQMKRVAIIGAAAAYTIASADDAMAQRIAGETASNGTRRLGHAWMLAQNALHDATAETFASDYAWAVNKLETAHKFELADLASIVELADDRATVQTYIDQMTAVINTASAAHQKALKTQAGLKAKELKQTVPGTRLSKEEKRAARLVPKRTGKARAQGYMGWRGVFGEIDDAMKEKYPFSRRDVASTSELNCLIDGQRSVLEIKNLLDGQYPRLSKLEAVLNYVRLLEATGYVTL